MDNFGRLSRAESDMGNKILLTGGCGYIGSHVAVRLAEAGYEPVLFDNLSNSQAQVAEAISDIIGAPIIFEKGDILDEAHLQRVLRDYNIEAVVHFAALKSVAESLTEAPAYYRTNVGGTLTLLHAMRAVGVKRLLYSSSAAIYGETDKVPINEQAIPAPINPYGNSKWLAEQILRDCAAADESLSFCALRYFNPIGAHPSAKIGEQPSGTPNNLLPLVMRAASDGAPLAVFGDDYSTRDGTCIRDYIHVMDLAEGHLAALRYLEGRQGYGCFNLGTENGASVMEIITAFERVTGVSVPHKIAARRAGDVAILLADCRAAKAELGWKAQIGLDDMLKTAWQWACNNKAN